MFFNCGHSSVVERLVANEKVEGSTPFARSIYMFGKITNVFQNYVSSRDIRQFKKNFFYYIFFRLIRKKLNSKIKIKIYNFYILASNKKNEMSHSLLRKCDFEDIQEIRLINSIAKNSLIYLFDCGSNFGFYSLYIASKNKKNKIVAFEASPFTYMDMKKNISLNNFSSIKINNLAVSNTENLKLTFYESENDWESSITHSNFSSKSKILVKTTTLDVLTKKQIFDNYTVIIKLDVEGHEMNVIDGSLSLIKKCSPIIILEFSKFINKDKNYNYSYLKSFLINYDYDIYNAKYEITTLENILDEIKNLPNNMYGIGNNFLIKRGSNMEKIIKNVRAS